QKAERERELILEGEEAHLLRAPVLEHLEVALIQIGNEAAMLGLDAEDHVHQIGVGDDGGNLRRSLRLGVRRQCTHSCAWQFLCCRERRECGKREEQMRLENARRHLRVPSSLGRAAAPQGCGGVRAEGTNLHFLLDTTASKFYTFT